MKSLTTLADLATNLSTNTSTANRTLMKQLINDAHRYLLQKYFSNETTYSITTVGSLSLTLTGSLAIGATSATLSSAWTYYSTRILVTFSSGELRSCRVLKNSTSITWDAPLTATATTAITAGMQYYPLPPNYSKLKSLTIRVGNLQWTPTEILTTQEWNQLNVFPYYSDIPNNFFIYPGGDHGAQVGIWPVPSTTGNVITYSYKYRVPDLSIEDFTGASGGTASVATGSTTVTGTGTSFPITVNPQLESRWIQFASPLGDNLWYQISQVTSTTNIELYQPYQGNGVTATGSAFTIGQMPILMEDFHDLLVYRALFIYFSSINPDKQKAMTFKGLYDDGEKRLAEYSGSNTVDVNLGRRPQTLNPNLFPQDIGDSN